MAKTLKPALEYFPCAVRILDDPKVALVMIEHGSDVAVVLLRLLGEIYGREGYWLPWDDDECALLFALNTCHGTVTVEKARAIVAALLKRGFFDQAVYDRTGKLTSHGLQERWINAMKQTHRAYSVDPELCLVEGEGEEETPSSEVVQKPSEDFAKSSEVVRTTSENFVVKKKEKKSITNQPTNARVREGAPEGTEDHPPDPVRAEVVRILIPPGDYSVDKALIDRIVEGIHAGIPGFTPRDLKRISKRADDECARYERSDGRSGKKHRWMTIADEVEARYKSAGRPWENEYAGENEPPPRPRSSPIAAPPPPDHPEEEDPDALLAQLLDRDTDPGGETLDQTQKRLRCSPGEAYTERANWRRLKQFVPQP